MDSVKLRSHVGKDGILHLEIPIGMTDKEVEVKVIYQALGIPTQQKAPENLGYSSGKNLILTPSIDFHSLAKN